MNLNKPFDIHAYAAQLICPPAATRKACPDCLAADGGYRGTEVCAGCYADRYGQTPDERDTGDSE